MQNPVIELTYNLPGELVKYFSSASCGAGRERVWETLETPLGACVFSCLTLFPLETGNPKLPHRTRRTDTDRERERYRVTRATVIRGSRRGGERKEKSHSAISAAQSSKANKNIKVTLDDFVAYLAGYAKKGRAKEWVGLKMG